MTDRDQNTTILFDLVFKHLHTLERRLDELEQQVGSIRRHVQMPPLDDSGTIHLEWVPGPAKRGQK